VLFICRWSSCLSSLNDSFYHANCDFVFMFPMNKIYPSATMYDYLYGIPGINSNVYKGRNSGLYTLHVVYLFFSEVPGTNIFAPIYINYLVI
jgi:hypothetical protein